MGVLNNKYIVWGSVIAVITTTAAIIINKQRKIKLKDRIVKKIEEGVAESGTFEDLKTGDAFSTSYWKTVPSTAKLLTVVQAQAIQKELASSTSCDDVYETIKKGISNQAQMSQISFYVSQGGSDLYTEIEKIGKKDLNLFGVVNVGWTGLFKSKCVEDIYAYLKKLPKY